MTGAARLAGFLAELGAQGRLDIADPKTAAFQLIALCHDRLFKARLCGYAPEPTPSELEAEVATGVDTFLRAFGR